MSYYSQMNESKFHVQSKYANQVMKALKNESYEFELDNDKNIVGIDFVGSKLRDEFYIFQKIAKYVDDSSYIEMSGEGGFTWRWCFCNGICTEVDAKIVWPEE